MRVEQIAPGFWLPGSWSDQYDNWSGEPTGQLSQHQHIEAYLGFIVRLEYALANKLTSRQHLRAALGSGLAWHLGALDTIGTFARKQAEAFCEDNPNEQTFLPRLGACSRNDLPQSRSTRSYASSRLHALRADRRRPLSTGAEPLGTSALHRYKVNCIPTDEIHSLGKGFAVFSVVAVSLKNRAFRTAQGSDADTDGVEELLTTIDELGGADAWLAALECEAHRIICYPAGARTPRQARVTGFKERHWAPMIPVARTLPCP